MCLCPGSTPGSRHFCAAKVSLGLPPRQGQCRHTQRERHRNQGMAWDYPPVKRQKWGKRWRERKRERDGGGINNRVTLFEKQVRAEERG